MHSLWYFTSWARRRRPHRPQDGSVLVSTTSTSRTLSRTLLLLGLRTIDEQFHTPISMNTTLPVPWLSIYYGQQRPMCPRTMPSTFDMSHHDTTRHTPTLPSTPYSGLFSTPDHSFPPPHPNILRIHLHDPPARVNCNCACAAHTLARVRLQSRKAISNAVSRVI